LPESRALRIPYSEPGQQKHAAVIGMWLFLGTELMLFGGFFTAFGYFRALYPQGFVSASQLADFWLGAGNTAVLLISSLAMALAVHAAKTGRRRGVTIYLSLTILLGSAFLALKGVEYAHHIHDHLWPAAGFAYPDPPFQQAAQLFFYLYFAMTGLHALHMIGGIALMAVLIYFNQRKTFSAEYHTPVELAGLYWHFVDIVWIFLFPLFYLAGGH
jgi:cytochrome c oxidase subunit 3